MKKITLILTVAIATIFFSFKTLESNVWSLDKNHAKLGFTITHLMVSDVDGLFSKFDATITSAKPDFSDAVMEMTADVASINTDNDKRDTHLKSADFFDVAKFPTISFKSTSFASAGAQKYTVKGNLTMHGVTKPIVLNALIRQGISPMTKAPIAGFKITGTIKRSDFGVGSYPAAILSDEVDIKANGEFAKK